MKTLGIVLAVIGGVWIVGRLSRLSPNHPANALGFQLKISVGGGEAYIAQRPDYQDMGLYPSLGPGDETAQIAGGFVVGDGGGES